jgi:putative transposase
MARKPRVEVEGGLYHLITRGVDRRDIFHSPEDHKKFLWLLETQKAKLPFFLYAYCLMTNHIHLLIERRSDDVGKVMHRVLTGYTQYYNRRYRRSGHVLQGRHKAILCQSDRYLIELVRYIHLNPVRAKMVRRPESYPFSSHGAYLGTVPDGTLDVDPVLRHFGAKRADARESYGEFVTAGLKSGPQEHLYSAPNGILGSEEFVDEMIHRIGHHDTKAAAIRRKQKAAAQKPDIDRLLAHVAAVGEVPREDICSSSKSKRSGFSKDAFVLAARHLGSGVTSLATMTGISSSSISRRHDNARARIPNDRDLSSVIDQILAKYRDSEN